MKLLEISTGLKLPADALMQPIAFLGNRGSGKTFGGMKIYELAHDAEVQCIAIDGIGKWWGLRLAANGNGPGLSDVYIFGGKRADFAITPDRGAFVARVLVERRIHAILDVSQMRKGQRQKFLTEFAEEFHLLKKQEDTPAPSILFLEEAHQVLPQKTFGPDQAQMLGAFEDLIREGRNAGIGVVIMDQRPATVNKDALALVEILIAGRTTYEIDRKVYTGWVVQRVGDAGELRINLEERLPFLKAGEAFVYAPMFEIFEEIKILPKRTFDSSATAKIGIKATAIGTLTPVDVERVNGAMAEVTAEVAAKDPNALRRKVAELEGKLAAALKSKAAPAPETKRFKVPIIPEKAVARLEAVEAKSIKAVQALTQATDAFRRALEQARRDFPIRDLGNAGPAPVPLPPLQLDRRAFLAQMKPSPAQLGPKKWAEQRRAEEASSDVRLGSGETRMLHALARQHPRGMTRRQLGILSGFSASGGTFRTYLPKLSSSGLVRYRGSLIELTPKGVELAGDALRFGPRTAVDLQALWRSVLGAGERKLLDVLIRVHPDALSREVLGIESGFAHGGGTFRTYLPKLHTLGLVEYGADKSVRAADELLTGEAS